jgi:hypothetical protein
MNSMLQELRNSDCTTIRPSTIHHHALITDPPYSPHVHERMTSCAQAGHIKGVRHRGAGFGPLTSELRQYIALAGGHAKRWTLVYSDIQGIHAWEMALARHIRTMPVICSGGSAEGGGVVGSMPWIRWSSPQQSGDRPPSGCEMIIMAHAPGRIVWGGPGNLTHLLHKCERGDQKHPTAKPLDQALDLVAWHTDPGERVYDPCAGQATLGVACILLGREYVGCETMPTHWRAGSERMAKAKCGELGVRDFERYRRWARQYGILPVPTVRPLTFRKGVPQ